MLPPTHPHRRRARVALVFASALLVSGGTCFGQAPVTIDLAPVKDNTMFEEGEESSGAGKLLFAGRTGTNAGFPPPSRRALLAFDVAASIPAGATIQSASLTLRVTNSPDSSTTTMNLHRLSKDWGEAGSDSGNGGAGAPAQGGDVTWAENFFGTEDWAVAGGDFVATSSAAAGVSFANTNPVWTSAQLATDVQGFLDNPATNFGWILIGDESQFLTARGFASKENGTVANRPKLTIEYTVPQLSNLEQWIAEFYDENEPVDMTEDLDGDGLDATFEYGAGLDPKTANEVSEAYSIVIDRDDPNNRVVAKFVRDPDADDLTYRMEGSFNAEPGSWFTLAESTGGAAPTGDGVVSDEEIIGRAPFREVTVKQTPAFDGETDAYVRFVVILAP